MPLQSRVLNRMKILILNGSLKAILQQKIIGVRKSLQHNNTLKKRFRTVTINQVAELMLQFIDILKPKVKEALIEKIMINAETTV